MAPQDAEEGSSLNFNLCKAEKKPSWFSALGR
jgi:hypothetical protein